MSPSNVSSDHGELECCWSILDFKAKHISCTILQSSHSFTLIGNHIRRGMEISSQIDLVQPQVLKS